MDIPVEQAVALFQAFKAQLMKFDKAHSSSLSVFDASYVIKSRDSRVFELTLIAKYNDLSGHGYVDNEVKLKGNQLSVSPESVEHLAQHLAFKLLGIKA